MPTSDNLKAARSIRSQVAKRVEKIMKAIGVSRQQVWQLKMHKEGRCVSCGEKAVNKNHCAPCREKHRARARKWVRKNAGIPLNTPLHKRRTKAEMAKAKMEGSKNN